MYCFFFVCTPPGQLQYALRPSRDGDRNLPYSDYIASSHASGEFLDCKFLWRVRCMLAYWQRKKTCSRARHRASCKYVILVKMHMYTTKAWGGQSSLIMGPMPAWSTWNPHPTASLTTSSSYTYTSSSSTTTTTNYPSVYTPYSPYGWTQAPINPVGIGPNYWNDWSASSSMYPDYQTSIYNPYPYTWFNNNWLYGRQATGLLSFSQSCSTWHPLLLCC